MGPRLLVVLVLLLVGTPARAADLPAIKGWHKAGPTESYDRATVWQAIDGAAELFVAYGFRGLRTQDYRRGKLRVTVQVYEQQSALDAFGVLGRERPADPKVPHCLARKGRHYIKVLTIQGELDARRCRGLLAALGKALPGADGPPPELALLPSSGRVTGSAGYTRKSYLGSRRLQRCLHASYRSGDSKPYILFLMLPGPKRSVDALWKEQAAHFKAQRLDGTPLLSGSIPYRGTLVLMRGKAGLRGVVGAGDLRASAAALRGWR